MYDSESAGVSAPPWLQVSGDPLSLRLLLVVAKCRRNYWTSGVVSHSQPGPCIYHLGFTCQKSSVRLLGTIFMLFQRNAVLCAEKPEVLEIEDPRITWFRTWSHGGHACLEIDAVRKMDSRLLLGVPVSSLTMPSCINRKALSTTNLVD